VAGNATAADRQPVDTSKILNYNPEMEYRRQGSTNWMVSAVCLGGHSRSSLEERRDAECLRGRRDKMYLALSHCGREVRSEEYRTAKKLLESLDEVLRDSKQEYTDLWRITCLEPGGQHSFNTSCEIVEALETAKKQGKARAVGFSSHDRRWIQFMIEYFPQIDVVCFPFTTFSKKAPSDSLFPALKKCDVGAFGIKPFGKGSLFTGDREEDFRRARLALRYILYTNTVTRSAASWTCKRRPSWSGSTARCSPDCLRTTSGSRTGSTYNRMAGAGLPSASACRGGAWDVHGAHPAGEALRPGSRGER